MKSKRDGGFILVAVLWLLGALATLAVIYSLSVRESVVAFSARDGRVQAQALAQAGVELAVQQMTAVPGVRPSFGRMTLHRGAADVAVQYTAENGRIDLNAAPREVLAGLFVGLGARTEEAAGLADRIAAWRTPPSAGSAEDEVSLYRMAGKPYGPRRGLFQHVNEVALVLGFPGPLLDRALPYLTVHSGQPEVNVLIAAPEVLAALPGMTPARLHDLELMRDKAPQDVLRARMGAAARYVTAQAGNSVRISVDVFQDIGSLDTGARVQNAGRRTRTRTEVVALVLNGDVEPYRVLSWRDEIGEPSLAGAMR
jgi:general secretion pathway protein K